jgi:Flp pilus assembly pilin Flp
VILWCKATAVYARARFGRGEAGNALVEYVLLAALIAVVCLLAITYLGGETSSKYSYMAEQISQY